MCAHARVYVRTHHLAILIGGSSSRKTPRAALCPQHLSRALACLRPASFQNGAGCLEAKPPQPRPCRLLPLRRGLGPKRPGTSLGTEGQARWAGLGWRVAGVRPGRPRRDTVPGDCAQV